MTKRLPLLVLVFIAFFSSCKKDGGLQNPENPLAIDTTTNPNPPVTDTTPPPTYDSSYVWKDNDNLLFGNPSNAKHVLDSVNNYLMDKEYYVISYSRDLGRPNWVSWHLYPGDLGAITRQNDFRADNALPTGWYQVASNSYANSGFDRGHNCPSGDRTSNSWANSSTFLMTNMIPQAPKNNQQTWANMENYLRSLVVDGYEVYIVMGSYGEGGSGSKGYASTIDNGRVKVPAYVWKSALVIPNGDNDTARVDANTRLITVAVPNTNNVNSDWKSYRVSAEVIEYATGYKLFTRLPEEIRELLIEKTDNK